MGMFYEVAGRALPRDARALAANLFGLAAAFAAPVAAPVCAALALDRGWRAVGLVLLVLAVRPAGEMAAEALGRYGDAYPPARWWAWRICFAASLIATGLTITHGT